ncbi:MAG: hypothetical protein JJE22_08925, partial [Bacteroidia bacterium]|nr:hypothetical protein [Bacteroidia bacterium]
LHESHDKIRFQGIRTLTAKDLYFLLIGGGSDLYTSSFLYVYKKLLEKTEKEGLDKFFDDIGYYQFDQFLSNISVYGLVNDLVGKIREKKFASLVGKYLANLQNTQIKDDEIILNAMTISEVLYAIRNYPDLKTPLIEELDNIEKTNVENDILLQRMFLGFKDILLDKNEYNTDETYNVLPIDRLKKNGAIVQVWFFYDDEDAAKSFSSGTAEFDKKTWYKTDLGNYIVFNSMVGNNMKVYMNKPNTDSGYEAAQDEMLQAIKQEGCTVTSFIHRGHSYYLYHSLTLMTPSAQFVFLGSCGGTNEVLKVFEINPDVNVIVTRHLGAKLINDKLLARINREIIDNRDLNWDTLWEEFNRMFQSKLEKDLFSSYIPPNKYIGVKFIRKVF